MNKLLEIWQRVPDWLKGASVGAFTGVPPYILFPLFLFINQWVDVPDFLGALLVSALRPLFFLMFTSGTGSLPEFSPILIWGVLGLFCAKIWGFRRGMVVLLIIEVIELGFNTIFVMATVAASHS